MPPRGSVQDRVLREMVFRERQEKLAYLDAMSSMIGQMFNVNTDKMFGHIKHKYAAEVFQEAYDSDVLRERIRMLRYIQTDIKRKRKDEVDTMTKLENLGKLYDTKEVKE